MKKTNKPKCHICRSSDLSYSSSTLFKTSVVCGSCGASWHEGRTEQARQRYEKLLAAGR